MVGRSSKSPPLVNEVVGRLEDARSIFFQVIPMQIVEAGGERIGEDEVCLHYRKFCFKKYVCEINAKRMTKMIQYRKFPNNSSVVEEK